MSEPLRVFVADRVVLVPPGATAAAAVAGCDPALAERLEDGSAYLTDGRGIRLAATAPLFSGAIVRVVLSARAARDEADADA